MPKFKLYNAKLRLGGSVLNEVPLVDATAPEIDVLRMLHGGSDAVVGIKEVGHVERAHADERARLNQTYAGAGDNIEGQAKKKLAAIRDLFGNDRLPLPLELEEVQAAEVEDEAPAPVEKIIRTKASKSVAAPAFAE